MHIQRMCAAFVTAKSVIALSMLQTVHKRVSYQKVVTRAYGLKSKLALFLTTDILCNACHGTCINQIVMHIMLNLCYIYKHQL